MSKVYMTIDDIVMKVEEISYVGKLDRHVNYASHGSGNTTYFVPLIVGGQKIEIKGKDKEHAEELRAQIVKRLK